MRNRTEKGIKVSGTDKTIMYYNKYAREFAAGTIGADFRSIQDLFADRLPKGAHILDFGCGAGRDARYFRERGFQVEAIDGSKELCSIASKYSGVPVKQKLFQDLDETECYDGIWACASILHVPSAHLKSLFRKMIKALKKHGILYVSFKYGNFEGERNGRYFTDMTEERFAKFLADIEELQQEEQWVTSDVRPERGNEKWLNLILRKQ
ncbi:MAG: class I SAM-dependent methyltransferase [Lachnospiraceae bacterium]|nr:class I SAM-dependent methyltransferase [Lachnospiraceae bacterium]